jgi:DNA-binding transcriptional regulator YiaG
VRALRERLGDSQQQFAERLGTRQQTVSEWERGASRPRRMAQRLLTMLAEEAAAYDASGREPSP